MTPEDVDHLLSRSRPPALDAALRERALAAARARWDARAPLRWPWVAAATAAALVALDVGVCGWGADSRATAPGVGAVASAPAAGTPTLLAALRNRGAIGGMP